MPISSRFDADGKIKKLSFYGNHWTGERAGKALFNSAPIMRLLETKAFCHGEAISSAMRQDISELVTSMLAGTKSSLARLISLVESGDLDALEIKEMISPHLGKAYRVGITGPPGGGKSTLVDKLTIIIRSKGLSVGIVAVDPSSVITGGAVLGDRIRMQQHYLDDGVFIRSMATRGSYGGLSGAVSTTLNLLDAFGKDIIMVETAGVGQTEVSIAEIADTVIAVLFPGFGDGIQLMKAGLIEIADIIVVNKADYEGAGRFVSELREALILSPRKVEQSVIVTQAINNIGIGELYQELEEHWKLLRSSPTTNIEDSVAKGG